ALVTDGPVWVASLAAPPHNEESVWFPLGRTTGFLVTGQAASPHRNNHTVNMPEDDPFREKYEELTKCLK
ncbi:MAG: hypothetical protein PUE58_03390, partial [Lachnospiraceae bacterium]|nr:hypothetical protein [Lachnospiraceae bacterium]